MSNWHVAPDLGQLITQVKGMHPGVVVGTIGDQAHQGEPSDHNPDADGSVNAGDFMIGSHFTNGDADEFALWLQSGKDGRLAYVIWDRHIMSSTQDPWKWRDYTGSDPHTGHVHVSVNHTPANERNTSAWELGWKDHIMVDLDGYSLPILKAGDNDADFAGYHAIARAQCLINYQVKTDISVDGVYGPATTGALKSMGFGDGKTIDLNVWVRLAGLSTK